MPIRISNRVLILLMAIVVEVTPATTSMWAGRKRRSFREGRPGVVMRTVTTTAPEPSTCTTTASSSGRLLSSMVFWIVAYADVAEYHASQLVLQACVFDRF